MIHAAPFARVVAVAILAGALFHARVALATPLPLTGVNLSGLEFGVSNGNVNLPGTFNTHYFAPNNAEIDYYTAKGMNTFRLPFRWERIEQSLPANPNNPAVFNATEIGRLDTFINYTTSKNAYTILDPHNFQRYYPDTNNFQQSAKGLVGSDPNVPDAAYAEFWRGLANRYKNNSHVIFNLMNEPANMPTNQLVTSQNLAIAAIRQTGATNLILVPGNRFTGAWTWNNSDSFNGQFNPSNASAMLNIVDPGNNFAFDVHQYMDSDGSGGSDGINNNDPNTGRDRLVAFTNWLTANNRRGFLGEFAVANSRIGTGGSGNTSKIGDELLTTMLQYMQDNSSAWLGWQWWGGGPNWGNYMFALDPTNLGQSSQTDRPAMGVLQPFLTVPEPVGVACLGGIAVMGRFAVARRRGRRV